MAPEHSRDELSDAFATARAALDVLVFAPLGLGAKLVDDAPVAVKRVRQELLNARFIGRLSVEQGVVKLRGRNSASERVDRPVAETEIENVDGLPIAGYDEMPAIEIVGMLDSLTPAQRTLIAEHETSHRQRRTVLGKIAQLAE